MERRTLGSTDLELSVITFGAWAAGGWLWGGSDQKEAVKAMRAAYDLGMTSIDTAAIYGQGLSEKIVREAISEIPREKVEILTKGGMRWDLEKPRGDFAMESKDPDGKEITIYKYASKESLIKECEDSLQRLGTDYIDLYQVHWPDSTTPVEETMEALLRLKEQGKILQAGVSNYSVDMMETAESVMPFASNQVPYSMVHRDIEEHVLPWCRKHKKGILAYSPLQRGLLTGKMSPGQTFDKGDNRKDMIHYSDENIRRTNKFLDQIRPIAKSKQATLAQLVIAWTTRQPGITITLVGARNAKQAIENAKAAELTLTSEEAKFIDDKLDLLRLEGA